MYYYYYIKENFVIGDAFVWRYLYKSSFKDIYSCLVKTSETPKYRKMASIQFSGLHGRNVSYGSCTNCYIICYPLAASYFSDRLYIHLSVSSAKAEETSLHMFWDCPKIQDYWFDAQGWLQTSFTRCTDIIFSKELVILGSKVNMVTDRILDLCILIAKYSIFISKLNVFTRFLKNRAVLDK